MATIDTARLFLTTWADRHRDDFAALHADPQVMADQGGPLSRADSDEKFFRYRDALLRYGTSRWAIEDQRGQFLGYAGVMFSPTPQHPLGRHYEVGWRLKRTAWGQGYATESASAALERCFSDLSCREVFAYTGPSNLRSQAVMRALGLTRDPTRDFFAKSEAGSTGKGLVWVASPNTFGLAPAEHSTQ